MTREHEGKNRNQAGRGARRWLPYAGMAVLAALLTAGLWPRPVLVETATATVGPLRASVNEEGKTRVKQRFTVTTPVTGHLRRISFKAGAEVTSNQTVLAVIDPISPVLLDARSSALAEAKRDTATANVGRARDAHRFAESELKRSTQLASEKTISIQDLENVQWREASTARELSSAESALREAEAELGEFNGSSSGTNLISAPIEVKSPVTGRILRIFEESARVVISGAPLLEVGDPSDLEVVIEVLSRDGALIAPGAKVELEHWGGREPLQAKVRLVEPSAFTKISALGVEEQRVNVIADLLTPLAQRPGVGDAFRVEGRVIMWEDPRALKVPSGALFRQGENWAAFVLADGHARRRGVTVGRSSGTETQVLSGLKEGETVIQYPGDKVTDGTRVRPLTLNPAR